VETSKTASTEYDFDRGRLVMTPAIVFGSDGRKIGKVVEVADDYILIQKGFFFPKEFFIPTWAIAWEDPDRIDLGITKAASQALGRADLPPAGDTWFDANVTRELPPAKEPFADSVITAKWECSDGRS
jgi:hypothetical protein